VELIARLFQRFEEACDLGGDVFLADRNAVDGDDPLLDDDGASDGDSGRDSDAFVGADIGSL